MIAPPIVSIPPIIKFSGVEQTDPLSILTNIKGAKLALAIERQPKPPCVDRGDGLPCEFYRRCASERMACRAFYAYTREPMHPKEYRQWRLMERDPSEKLYSKTYK